MGNCITDEVALASIVAEGAGAEESTILAEMVDVQKDCEEAAMIVKEVTIAPIGGKSGPSIVGGKEG